MHYIEIQKKENLFYISLNRPDKANAFNDEFIIELTTALQQAEQDSKTTIVILRANGKHFCAGADLNWMQQMVNFSKEENKKDAIQLSNLFQTLNHLKKPTIAVVKGSAFGGGVGLLACCDIVLAAEQASFCFSEATVGLTPATIAPYVLQKIGLSAARRYFLSAEKFNAVQAEKIGLVQEICDETKIDQIAYELASKMSTYSPQALTVTKELLFKLPKDEKMAIDYTAELIADIRTSAEGQEGLKAFLEKRKPNWCQNVP